MQIKRLNWIFLTIFTSMQTHTMELDEQLFTKMLKGNIATRSELVALGTILQRRDGRALLHCVVLLDQYKVAKYLLECGADANIANYMDKTTPLFDVPSIDIAELLFAHGAKLNVTDAYGNSLLHSDPACYLPEITEWFIKHGADVNAVNNAKQTPLHQARRKKIAELLLAHGAKLNVVDENGDTPLHEVVEDDENIEIVELFINNGADIDAKGYSELTPLARACLNGAKSIVEILIKKDADVNQDSFGETPLHFAAEKGHTEIVEILLKNGAKPDL